MNARTLISAAALLLPLLVNAADENRLWGFSLRSVTGLSYAKIEADSLAGVYFAPTPKVQAVYGPVIGMDAEFLSPWYVGASIGMRYHRRGQNTATDTVMFADNPFPHELRTEMEINYVAVPLYMKAVYMHRHFWTALRAGVYAGLLMSEERKWIIDGNEAAPGTAYSPHVETSALDAGVVGGLEIGGRFGRHGIYIAGDYEVGMRDIEVTLSGEARNRAVMGTVGYRWFF